MKALIIGVAVGFGFAFIAVSVTAVFLVQAKRTQARAGWRLRPVIVAAEDIPQGKTISFEVLAQRPLPEQFTTESDVTADQVPVIVGKRINVPLAAGDVVKWADFAQMPPPELSTECGTSVLPKVREATANARREALTRFQAAMGPPLPPPPRLPASPGGDTEIVVLKEDVAEGKTVRLAALTTRVQPGQFVTPSNVLASDRDSVAGAHAIVPMQAGDPLLWQQLDSLKRPRSFSACAILVNQAVEETFKRVAGEEARAFVGAKEKRR